MLHVYFIGNYLFYIIKAEKVMNNKENIAWLDGFLKGTVAVGALSCNVTFNALSMTLSKENFVQSDMDFINDDSNSALLGVDFSLLRLSPCELILDWSMVVTNNFNRVFTELNRGSFQHLLTQVLDMLDMIVSEKYSGEIFLCHAEIGDASGDYLFFCDDNEEYLILSFLHHQ